jgi:large subunit ribosomal protein L35
MPCAVFAIRSESGSQVFCVSKTTYIHTINGVVMPKMKTKSGAKKRFVVRPGGTVKRGSAFKRHILTKKTTKNKRQLRGIAAVAKSDIKAVRAMMPYA